MLIDIICLNLYLVVGIVIDLGGWIVYFLVMSKEMCFFIVVDIKMVIEYVDDDMVVIIDGIYGWVIL